MATDPELVAQLAVLSQGREPTFTDQAAINASLPDPPSSAADGVAIDGETIAVLGVRLRQDAASQRAEVVVDTVDDTATYEVILNGTNYTYAASPGDLETEIVEGLRDDINGGVGFTASVDGTTLIVQGDDADNYTVGVTASGTGALSYTLEATDVTFAVWALPVGLSSWHLVRSLDAVNATVNTIERIVCAGLSRVFVQITDTDGVVVPFVGPCALE